LKHLFTLTDCIAIQIRESSRPKACKGDLELNLGYNTDINSNVESEGPTCKSTFNTPCHSAQQDLSGCKHPAELHSWENGQEHNTWLRHFTSHSSCADGGEEMEAHGLVGVCQNSNLQEFEDKGLEVSDELLFSIQRYHHLHLKRITSNSEMAPEPMPVAKGSIERLLSKDHSLIDPAKLRLLGLNKTADLCAVPIEGAGVFDGAATITRRQFLEVTETLQQPATLSRALDKSESPECQQLVSKTSFSSAEDSADQEHEDGCESMSYQSVESSRQCERHAEEVSAGCTELHIDSNDCALLPVALAVAGIENGCTNINCRGEPWARK
jgi:hypothetical protein